MGASSALQGLYEPGTIAWDLTNADRIREAEESLEFLLAKENQLRNEVDNLVQVVPKSQAYCGTANCTMTHWFEVRRWENETDELHETELIYTSASTLCGASISDTECDTSGPEAAARNKAAQTRNTIRSAHLTPEYHDIIASLEWHLPVDPQDIDPGPDPGTGGQCEESTVATDGTFADSEAHCTDSCESVRASPNASPVLLGRVGGGPARRAVLSRLHRSASRRPAPVAPQTSRAGLDTDA